MPQRVSWFQTATDIDSSCSAIVRERVLDSLKINLYDAALKELKALFLLDDAMSICFGGKFTCDAVMFHSGVSLFRLLGGSHPRKTIENPQIFELLECSDHSNIVKPR